MYSIYNDGYFQHALRNKLHKGVFSRNIGKTTVHVP